MAILSEQKRTMLRDLGWTLLKSGRFREIWEKGNAKVEIYLGKAHGTGTLDLLDEFLTVYRDRIQTDK